MPQDRVSPELNEQLRRDRANIAAELPELAERRDRMMEAQAEETFSGTCAGRFITAVAWCARSPPPPESRRKRSAGNSSKGRGHCVPMSRTV